MSVPDAMPEGDEFAAPARARRVAEERRALANTRRVKRLRIALPAIAGAIFVVLTAGALIPKLFPLAALAGLSLTADGLVMNEPRLAGHLGEGRRYEVVAARAIQSLMDPSRLSLEGLDADLDMGEGRRVTMHSAQASYDTDTEILVLGDGAEIRSSEGEHVTVPSATVFLKEGRVESTDGVTITSPRGTIEAGRVDILDGGALLRFTGGVSITVQPAS